MFSLPVKICFDLSVFFIYLFLVLNNFTKNIFWVNIKFSISEYVWSFIALMDITFYHFKTTKGTSKVYILYKAHINRNPSSGYAVSTRQHEPYTRANHQNKSANHVIMFHYMSLDPWVKPIYIETVIWSISFSWPCVVTVWVMKRDSMVIDPPATQCAVGS